MSLKEKLDETRRQAVDRIPPEALKLMHQATEELRESGIMDKVLKAGDKAPEFELPGQDGRVVRSSQVLKNGPMVLGIYRGIW